MRTSPLRRHCEQSEAIQNCVAPRWIAASPSAPRNDDFSLRVFAASREPLTQLGHARTLGICLTRSRKAAKKGSLIEGSVG
jgi:hypothetical protein